MPPGLLAEGVVWTSLALIWVGVLCADSPPSALGQLCAFAFEVACSGLGDESDVP